MLCLRLDEETFVESELFSTGISPFFDILLIGICKLSRISDLSNLTGYPAGKPVSLSQYPANL
jgi:hypothetical protein